MPLRTALITLALLTLSATAACAQEEATSSSYRSPVEIFYSEPKGRALPVKLHSEAGVGETGLEESGEFWNQAYVSKTGAPEEKNIFEKILDFIKSLFVGEEGFVHFAKVGGVSSDIEPATQELRDSLRPGSLSRSIYYQASIPNSALSFKSGDLKELFETAARSQCAPVSLLLAINHVETGGSVLNYSTSQVVRFTTPGWWTNASSEEISAGFCTNTCDKPDTVCIEGYTDVQGPMQFSKATWDGIIQTSAFKQTLQQEFGLPENYTPNRCNLRDSIVAAAVKIKQDSGTGVGQCSGWSESVVKGVARSYFGGCIVEWANPPWNYCDTVWDIHQSYSR